jgi:hypothetical protein
LVQLQHSRRSTQLRIILKGMSHAGISCPLTPVPHAPGDGSPRMPADINVAPSAMFNHVLLLGGILTRSCRRARETPLLKKAAIAAQLSARRAAHGRAREDMMTRKTLAGRALVLAGLLLAMRSADAAPPTAVPSPGYDARLRPRPCRALGRSIAIVTAGGRSVAALINGVGATERPDRPPPDRSGRVCVLPASALQPFFAFVAD